MQLAINAEQLPDTFFAIARRLSKHRAELVIFSTVLFVPVMQRTKNPFVLSNGKQDVVHSHGQAAALFQEVGLIGHHTSCTAFAGVWAVRGQVKRSPNLQILLSVNTTCNPLGTPRLSCMAWATLTPSLKYHPSHFLGAFPPLPKFIELAFRALSGRAL